MATFSARFHRFIATGLCSGFCPVAPGTAGSAAAVLLYWLGLARFPLWLFALTIAATYVLGAHAAARFDREQGTHDDGRIVIDEVVGQWIALFALPPTWPNLLLAFVLFRIADIFKPFPANRLDRLQSGHGVMLDDVAAAAWARLALLIWQVFAR